MKRRNLLKLGAGTLGVGVLGSATLTAGVRSDIISPESAKNNMTPDEALGKLIVGNQRFAHKKRGNLNQETASSTEVSGGKAPFASILSCADLRIRPEIIFDREVGDLFVVREAGNLATHQEVSSLEFGTSVLGSKVLMVLGHENCGAVQAALAGKAIPGQNTSLLSAIKSAVANTEGELGDRLNNPVRENILLQIERLKSSSLISQLIDDGKLKVVGGHYDPNSGLVTLVS